MSYALCSDVYCDRAGNVVAGVSVAVVNAVTGHSATLYADANGTSQIAGNVVLTDANGRFTFYAIPGTYNLTFTKTGYSTQTMQAVPVMASQDTIDAINEATYTRLMPLRGTVSCPSVQFQGATDTSAALGTLGLCVNADNNTAAGALLQANAADYTSTINGASSSGAYRKIKSTNPITLVHIGQVSMGGTYAVQTTGACNAASYQFARLEFDVGDNVKTLLWYEGPPTNYAGTPGTGSARQVILIGISEPTS